jgi:hypothetical protein
MQDAADAKLKTGGQGWIEEGKAARVIIQRTLETAARVRSSFCKAETNRA